MGLIGRLISPISPTRLSFRLHAHRVAVIDHFPAGLRRHGLASAVPGPDPDHAKHALLQHPRKTPRARAKRQRLARLAPCQRNPGERSGSAATCPRRKKRRRAPFSCALVTTSGRLAAASTETFAPQTAPGKSRKRTIRQKRDERSNDLSAIARSAEKRFSRRMKSSNSRQFIRATVECGKIGITCRITTGSFSSTAFAVSKEYIVKRFFSPYS